MRNADIPAMPFPGTQKVAPAVGVSKREHFAGLAMQGLMANGSIDPEIRGVNRIADLSLQAADALLDRLQRID